MELIILILLLMVDCFITSNYIDKIQIYTIICSVKSNINKPSMIHGRQATIYRVDYIVD